MKIRAEAVRVSALRFGNPGIARARRADPVWMDIRACAPTSRCAAGWSRACRSSNRRRSSYRGQTYHRYRRNRARAAREYRRHGCTSVHRIRLAGIDRAHDGPRERREPVREYPKVPELMVRDLVRHDECCAVVIGAAFEQPARKVDVSTGRSERRDEIRPGHHDDESLTLVHDTLQAPGHPFHALGGPPGRLDHALGDDLGVEPGAERESWLDVEVIRLQWTLPFEIA